MKVFLDTNLLIYLYNGGTAYQDKVIKIMNIYDCCISTQVLNELSSVSIKKYKLTGEQIKTAINEICAACSLEIIDRNIIEKALDIKERYGFSYYDCLILSSAIESGCEILFSEDMSDGQHVENVVITNPFRQK